MKFSISQELGKCSLASPRADGTEKLCPCMQLHPCDLWFVPLWPYTHLAACPGLTGIVAISAGSFQWWNCTQATWDKVFLQERAVSSSSTAPHTVISSFSTKLSLGWGDTRIEKKKKIRFPVLIFLKIRLFPFRNIESLLCFFFLIVSENSIKVNFHSQEKNVSQLLPPHLHTGHAQGM